MKATESTVDTVSKNSHGKVVPASMGFVNYSGLKFSPEFQNTQKQALQKGVL